MPEGDTIFKVAAALRPLLLEQVILAARGRRLGASARRLEGARVTRVQPLGKHLVLSCDNGLAVHVHLRMTGSWHGYAPGERWRRPAWQASLVLEVPDRVLVCFNAPLVELLPTSELDRRPDLRQLGPDLLADSFDASTALGRFRRPTRSSIPIGEMLLDQRVMAGVGNVFKSEVLFLEKLSPWARVADLSDGSLTAVIATCERLLRANVVTGSSARITTQGDVRARGAHLWVYGRTGRPCFQCGTRVLSRMQGEQARRTYWCPGCQGPGPDQGAIPGAARARPEGAI